MTTLDNNRRNWLDDRLEAFVDGELSAEEAARFDQIALMDEEIVQQLNLTRAISDGLGELDEAECPDFVTRNVMAHVRKDIRASYIERINLFFRDLSVSRLKPVLALALLLIVVLSSIRIGQNDSAPAPEVAQALDEVKWTLALLSDVGNTTAGAVKESVIENQMVLPMSRSMSTIMEN